MTFTAKTRDLDDGDIIRVHQVGDFHVLSKPEPGAPRGRWRFTALNLETGEVETHDAQPDFHWEIP